MDLINIVAMVPGALKRDEFLVLIPEGIDIDFLCEKGRESIKGFNPVKLLYFISLVSINTVQYYRKSLGEYQTRSHAVIDSGALVNTVGRDYKRYYELLYKHHVFTVRSPYSVSGKTPFGYGFHSNYRFSRFRLELLEDAAMSKQFVSKFNKSSTKTYEKIFWSRYGKEKFSLDFNVAEKRLFEHYLFDVNFPLIEFDKANQKLTTVEPLKLKKFAAYQGALKQLVKFVNGQYSFSRKSAPQKRRGLPTKYAPVGRFYNPISTLNKIIREMLYYQGEKLVQLDVKNCLPYLLSNHFAKNTRLTRKRYDRLNDCPAFRAKYLQEFLYPIGQDYFIPSGHSRLGRLDRLGQPDEGYPFNYFSKVDPVYQRTPKMRNSYRHRRWTSPNIFERSSWPLGNPRFPVQLGLESMLTRSPWSELGKMGGRNPHLTSRPNTFLGYSDKLAPFNLSINHSEKYSWANQAMDYPWQFATNCVGIKLPEINKSSSPSLFKGVESLAYWRGVSNGRFRPLFNISYEKLLTLFHREIDEFKKSCIKGVIYEELIPGIKVLYSADSWAQTYELYHKDKYIRNPAQDRALTKRLFISMIYAKNWQFKNVQEVFKKRYPVIHDILFTAKRRGYKILTNNLFKLEATLMIDTIARGLIKDHCCDVFTIHDCIAVIERHKSLAEKKMTQVFMETFGNVPKIQAE